MSAARNSVWLARADALGVTVTPATSAWRSGDDVTVTVTYAWDLGTVSKLVGVVSGGALTASGTLRSTVTARIE